MATREELLDECTNFYDEYDGKGKSPKEFDLDDLDVRRRGKQFKERQAQRKERDAAYQAARALYKRRNVDG